MLESYSKFFESVFRTIFLVWFCFWGCLDIFNLLLKYADFAQAKQQAGGLLYWFIEVFALIVSLSAGLTLFFFTINIPAAVVQRKRIGSIPLMTILVVFYYLLITLIKILASAVFKPDSFVEDVVFLIAWLLPSLVMLVVHLFYMHNLRLYNHSLSQQFEQKF